VYDIDSAKAQTFAQELELDFQVTARAVASARDAVAGCDLVVTATASKSPVIEGAWLDPGTHVSGVGSNSPAKRELDASVFSRSRTFVDFREQALQEAGDLQQALQSGAISADRIEAELGEIVAGLKPGRQNDQEITLFKSVGMAVEDIATATFAYQQAIAAGVGTELQLDGHAPVIVDGNGLSKMTQGARPVTVAGRVEPRV
jgi:alanine dehydrogenase